MVKGINSFTLSREVEELLDDASTALNISRSQLVEKAVRHYFATKIDEQSRREIKKISNFRDGLSRNRRIEEIAGGWQYNQNGKE